MAAEQNVSVKKIETPRKMKKCLILAILIGGLSEQAFGKSTEWDLSYEEPEGTLQIHESSVYPRTRFEYKGVRKVRTRMTYRSAQTNAQRQKYWSSESVDLFSCADRLKRTVSITEFGGKFQNGRIVGRFSARNPVPVPVRPGSTDELILGEANCNLLTGKWG